ncbi:hypothetical protein SmJEL517_g03900 [Synchytrium microbalum]|uniref:Aminoglycoside phosphotransferase domain-containing protein n=1 Tax=Synchytrium microbalum TaxID=1806994 RepID=A0A507BW42_9FUNG|nr:uncharacterized protein SmJEL517_g03900 [Synchytrium microbalum]TPX33067.1 hypothetical protein SmJEL517_g03900 [Synchytrium microbalum]
MKARIPELSLPLSVAQFKLGQSNPTYYVSDASSKKYVVRRRPPGNLLSQTAHRVDREFKVIDALYKHTKVPVPKVYFLCMDKSILGTEFYVMEFKEGRVYPDALLPDLSFDQRRAHYHGICDVLAALHKVDVDAVGLGQYAKRSGFYERQINMWKGLSSVQGATKDVETGVPVGMLPRFDDMLAWFQKNLIKDENCLIHGDAKSDNLLGHPLSDVANTFLNWYLPQSLGGYLDLPRPLPVPEADELIEYYCKQVGRPFPIPGFSFAVAFAIFRLGVVFQGIAARTALRQNSSANNAAGLMLPVANLILEIVDTGKLPSGQKQTTTPKL